MATYDQVDEYTNVYTQKYLFSGHSDSGTIPGSWETLINNTKIAIFKELSELYGMLEGYECCEKEKTQQDKG